MWSAILIFLGAVLFMVVGLLAFRRDARKALPKNLPPPLPDEPEDDWGSGRKPGPPRDPQP